MALLACSVEGWQDVEDSAYLPYCRVDANSAVIVRLEAEELWQELRNSHHVGWDQSIDKLLGEIRDTLDWAAEQQHPAKAETGVDNAKAVAAEPEAPDKDTDKDEPEKQAEAQGIRYGFFLV
jgi:hypothetical protein